ncbi:hypothetical protein BD779DRAFT_1478068 [Infundibulicybe gibba]|nr:hypothetical protein BD779DRAFT_1478068 [Infundibulicybe gibba]
MYGGHCGMALICAKDKVGWSEDITRGMRKDFHQHSKFSTNDITTSNSVTYLLSMVCPSEPSPGPRSLQVKNSQKDSDPGWVRKHSETSQTRPNKTCGYLQQGLGSTSKMTCFPRINPILIFLSAIVKVAKLVLTMYERQLPGQSRRHHCVTATTISGSVHNVQANDRDHPDGRCWAHVANGKWVLILLSMIGRSHNDYKQRLTNNV